MQLLRLNYTANETGVITSAVIELTDVYSKTMYPGLSKTSRKKKEAARLATISPDAQTVKYADLYDNIYWVLQYNRDNAAGYLQRKKDLLIKMHDGSAALRKQVLDLIDTEILQLINN